jgi:hypothetical protein
MAECIVEWAGETVCFTSKRRRKCEKVGARGDRPGVASGDGAVGDAPVGGVTLPAREVRSVEKNAGGFGGRQGHDEPRDPEREPCFCLRSLVPDMGEPGVVQGGLAGVDFGEGIGVEGINAVGIFSERFEDGFGEDPMPFFVDMNAVVREGEMRVFLPLFFHVSEDG